MKKSFLIHSIKSQAFNISSFSLIPIFYLITKSENYSETFLVYGIASGLAAGFESFHQNYLIRAFNKNPNSKAVEFAYKVFKINSILLLPIAMLFSFINFVFVKLFILTIFLVSTGGTKYMYTEIKKTIILYRLFLFFFFLLDQFKYSLILIALFYLRIDHLNPKKNIFKEIKELNISLLIKNNKIIYGSSIRLIGVERIKDILPSLLYMIIGGKKASLILANERIIKSLSGLAITIVMPYLLKVNLSPKFYLLSIFFLIINYFLLAISGSLIFYLLPFLVSAIISIDLIRSIGNKPVYLSHIASLPFFYFMYTLNYQLSFAVAIEYIVVIVMILMKVVSR